MINCELVLKLASHEQHELLHVDWSWKETFKDFLIDAINNYPTVVSISLNWGGDEISMHQGDLHYGTWEKHEGKWYQIHYDSIGYYYEGKPFKTMELSPLLNEGL